MIAVVLVSSQLNVGENVNKSLDSKLGFIKRIF